MRRSIALAATVLTGLLAAACTSGSGADGIPGKSRSGSVSSGQLTFVAALRTIGDCDAVLGHLKDEAGSRVGAYGLSGSGWYGFGSGDASTTRELAAGSATASAGSDSVRSSSNAAPDYSTTNVQEVGVDEADIVKTDGDRIITLTNGVLAVVDARAPSPTLVGRVQLAGDDFMPQEMLLAGTKLLVIGSGWNTDGRSGGGIAPAPAAQPANGIAMPISGASVATITEVDLSNPAKPKVGATLRVDGGYLSARLVGSVARVVVHSEPRNLEFVYPQSPAGENRAKKANQQVIAESTIEDWLPSYKLEGADGATVSEGRLPDCHRVDAPTEFAGFGSLSVLTFDLRTALGTGDAVTILAGGQTVYASASTLYVATTTYVEPAEQQDEALLPRFDRDFSTSIHAFDIRGTAPAKYEASGTVPGHLLNQFAMSEHEGVLRAATTKGAPWGGSSQNESLITVLEPHGEQLEKIGEVTNMGKGERIYAVRYADDVAYVVTFRQTDPFYTVDLSDPRNPKVVGELKIPGYSGYLHPIGDDLVIGVGQDASDQGRIRGAKLSLFDVHDLAAPKALDSWVVPNSQTGAEWDHRAFLWWPATTSIVLPLNDWNGGFTGAVVLKADRTTGIDEVGRVRADGSSNAKGDGVIQRSLVVGANLWTMSYTKLQSNALDGLALRGVVAVN